MWNRQRRDEVLLDVEDVALGHVSKMRWNDEDAWIVSEALTHEPLVSDEQFRAVRTLAAAGRRRPVVRKARPTSQPFALHGLVVCALCQRKMQGSANHGRAHYRCRYPSEYAMANELDHPRNVCVREDQILGPLDGWLVQVFDPDQLDTTLDALEAAASSTDDAGQAKAQAAGRRVAECDTRLTRYRAALEAGTDPAVVSAWIAEVQAERLAAEVELERATGQQNRRMSRDQLAALVNGFGHLLGVLATAAPEDKAEVYRKLGLQLTYDPSRRVVTVESHLGSDGNSPLPRGPRPSGGPTSGASSAEPVGESQCRRGDQSTCDTHRRLRPDDLTGQRYERITQHPCVISHGTPGCPLRKDRWSSFCIGAGAKGIGRRPSSSIVYGKAAATVPAGTAARSAIKRSSRIPSAIGTGRLPAAPPKPSLPRQPPFESSNRRERATTSRRWRPRCCARRRSVRRSSKAYGRRTSASP